MLSSRVDREYFRVSLWFTVSSSAAVVLAGALVLAPVIYVTAGAAAMRMVPPAGLFAAAFISALNYSRRRLEVNREGIRARGFMRGNLIVQIGWDEIERVESSVLFVRVHYKSQTHVPWCLNNVLCGAAASGGRWIRIPKSVEGAKSFAEKIIRVAPENNPLREYLIAHGLGF